MMRRALTQDDPTVPNDVTAPRAALPHEFLLSVVRGEPVGGVTPTLAQRIDAAAKAAPYFASRLAAVAHVGPDGGPIRHSIEVRFVRPGEVDP